ncbi:DUF6278 family protein [Arthrobacter sp. STN4]|uniref:DUF6278 family protein n=1 Tax=Arthrobacter sp. STN4 TaxID=2923276 RepID=UPI00211A41AC|nr:DUF6278 family protein [Arthrobacter sp. STN4]MCQ9166184.1 DUF6278 family protein [Arthrobacter sp. STN4]
MSEPVEPAESLQGLPPGPSRYYGEYKPFRLADPALPITNIGGYDELLHYFLARGLELPRSIDGLAAIDALIDSAVDVDELVALVPAIGMFYGDMLTHTISGAHWETRIGGSLIVRVSRSDAVEAVEVAQRRLIHAHPSLVQNYAHALEIVSNDQ